MSAKLDFEAGLLAKLNGGTLKELMSLNGIGKKRAQNIVAFREGERAFSKVGSLCVGGQALGTPHHLIPPDPAGQISDLKLCGFSDKLLSSFVQTNLISTISFS